MKVFHFILSTLLLGLPATHGKVAPAAIDLRSSPPTDHSFDDIQLVARDPQAQAATPASSSTLLSTTPHPVSPLTDLLVASTLPPSSPSQSNHPRNHNIAVAQNGTTFTPSTLRNIPAGDTLTFYFYPSNFSIVQSSFDHPCQPLPSSSSGSGIFSGFHPTEPNSQGISREKFVLTLPNNGGAPIWIYGLDGNDLLASPASAVGGTGNVCVKGMSLVINPPPKDVNTGRTSTGSGAGQTLSAYRRNAAALLQQDATLRANMSRVPEAIAGGEVRGVTEREKARWEGRHPLGGGKGNANGNGQGVGTSGVATFENRAGSCFDNKASWVGGIAIVLSGAMACGVLE